MRSEDLNHSYVEGANYGSCKCGWIGSFYQDAYSMEDNYKIQKTMRDEFHSHLSSIYSYNSVAEQLMSVNSSLVSITNYLYELKNSFKSSNF